MIPFVKDFYFRHIGLGFTIDALCVAEIQDEKRVFVYAPFRNDRRPINNVKYRNIQDFLTGRMDEG